MRRTITALLVTGAMLVTTAPAVSGPIPWQYSAALQAGAAGDRGDMLNLGAVSVHAEALGRLTPAASGSGWGWATVNLGTITYAGDVTPDYGGNYPIRSFRASLTLTDSGSGAGQTFTFQGDATASAVWSYWFDEVNHEPHNDLVGVDVIATVPADEQAATLGGNDYRVRLAARNHDDGAAYIDAEVMVGPAPEVPEPASLALAALGLAGVIVARRRRAV